MVRRLAWLLAITGTLILGIMTAFLFSSENHIRIPAIAALATFAMVVISYLGGIEFGLALREEGSNEHLRTMAMSMSALPSLASWGVFWLSSPRQQIGTAIGLFLMVWVADLYLARRGLIPSWFVDLRTAVTVIACVILGVAFYLI
jgi:Protein of unknown function (DUF3429)